MCRMIFEVMRLAKRMECASACRRCLDGPTPGVSESGSKRTALHTLREYARRRQAARSVWSASGLPALLDGPPAVVSESGSKLTALHTLREYGCVSHDGAAK